MKISTSISALLVIFCSLGCGPSSEEKAAREAQNSSPSINNNAGGTDLTSAQSSNLTSVQYDADEKSKNKNEVLKKESEFISSSAAVVDKKDTVHKFIRTAELKFKVVSVINATYDIEHIAKAQEGFVTFTNLTTHVDYTDNTIVSPDSILETTYFTVNNTITLRVPNTKLDTTLKLISKNIDFLDYRIIKAEDVALDLYANSLRQKRSERNQQRLTKAINERGKKLSETTTAEDLVYNREEQADEARISNMRIQDQINYSTINLTIYQRQTIKRELIANTKNITAYEPGLGYRLVEAFKTGWEVLKSIAIAIVKLWWLFLIAAFAYVIFKRFIKNK